MKKSQRRRVTSPGPEERRVVREAIAHGRNRAAALTRARKKIGASRDAALNGLLVAEGDSWFDYPFFNVLERLEEKFGFRTESVAHNGDTVESMAYDSSQLSKLQRLFERLGKGSVTPRAILLSGGGNDIAGTELAMLLNHAASGMKPLNEKIVDGVLNERLRFAISSVIGSITQFSKEHFGRVIPVLVHGYDYPIPDGRGYLGGSWFLPGPWLKPGFQQKGYVDLAQNAQVMRDLMDRINGLLQSLPSFPGLGHVSYLDLRTTLSGALAGGAYKRSWGNELHPTKTGFQMVAKLFSDRVMAFPAPPPLQKRARPQQATRPFPVHAGGRVARVENHRNDKPQSYKAKGSR